MSEIRVEVEREVAAAPETVLDVLRDYRAGRPRILPANFTQYRVESGGYGDGTVVTYRLKVGPRERTYRMQVSEGPPGRLVERDLGSSFVTTWTVEPGPRPGSSRVRIESTWQGAGGIGGFFEARFAPAGLRRVYADLLDRLAEAAAGSVVRR
jgi:hypothetical protein